MPQSWNVTHVVVAGLDRASNTSVLILLGSGNIESLPDFLRVCFGARETWMGKGSKQEAQGRTTLGGVSGQLVKEVAARIKQYGQVLLLGRRATHPSTTGSPDISFMHAVKHINIWSYVP